LPILVIDTCLAACQVAVFDGARRLAGASEPMERGHQERLATMAQEVMRAARVGFDRLAKIAVTTGPGSFTGQRVGIAFAKGLSLATGAPLAAIGTLEALAASADGEGAVAAAIDARRGNLYFQVFDRGRPLTPPEVIPIEEALRRLEGVPGPVRIVGPGALLLADDFPASRLAPIGWPSLDALGRIAAAAPPAADLRPLYLRAPDAKPATP